MDDNIKNFEIAAIRIRNLSRDHRIDHSLTSNNSDKQAQWYITNKHESNKQNNGRNSLHRRSRPPSHRDLVIYRSFACVCCTVVSFANEVWQRQIDDSIASMFVAYYRNRCRQRTLGDVHDVGNLRIFVIRIPDNNCVLGT
jgi:hypothetical protein